MPDDGVIELTRGDLLAALVKANDAIDDALAERHTAGVLDKPFIDLRLHALVKLRATIRRRIDSSRRD